MTWGEDLELAVQRVLEALEPGATAQQRRDALHAAQRHELTAEELLLAVIRKAAV